MSSRYTTSSGTVNFTAAAESWSEQSGADVDVLPFPGSNTFAVSISGQRETRRTFKALFATALDFRTIRNMRAAEGTLLVENWDTIAVNAILMRTQPDPIQVDGQVLATLEFLLY